MFINTEFSYDGVSSSYYGVYAVHPTGGLVQGQYGINRSIISEKIPNNSLPNFFGIEEEVLKFKIYLYAENGWDYDKRKAVSQWLFKNDYKPFISADNPQVVYECMVTGSSLFSLAGDLQGYIEIEFTCNAPYGWSNWSTIGYDLSYNEDVVGIQILNNCNLNDYIVYPEVEFMLSGSTSLSLINLSDGARETKFQNLTDGETIYFDNKKKIIKTNLSGTYRYANFNGKWLKLVMGYNNIQVIGKVIINIKMRFPIVI